MVLREHQSLEEMNTKVVHEFSKTLEMFGLTPAEARLFVTLYINSVPMTLDEMSEELGKSKTSMSTGIRSLVDQGLVERVWKKGFRKDLYTADQDLYKKFMTSYIKKWLTSAQERGDSLKGLENQLQEDYKNYPGHTLEEADQLMKKMEEMIQFYQLISTAFEDLYPDRK